MLIRQTFIPNDCRFSFLPQSRCLTPKSSLIFSRDALRGRRRTLTDTAGHRRRRRRSQKEPFQKPLLLLLPIRHRLVSAFAVCITRRRRRKWWSKNASSSFRKMSTKTTTTSPIFESSLSIPHLELPLLWRRRRRRIPIPLPISSSSAAATGIYHLPLKNPSFLPTHLHRSNLNGHHRNSPIRMRTYCTVLRCLKSPNAVRRR